uniref:Putative ovule protein n=1 Tax=Solanum chacoense TaxID=4108 RepID=A0A0V0I1I9_SOLCH
MLGNFVIISMVTYEQCEERDQRMVANPISPKFSRTLIIQEPALVCNSTKDCYISRWLTSNMFIVAKGGGCRTTSQ